MIQEFSENEQKKLRDGLRIISGKDYPLHLLLREQLLLISGTLTVLNAYLDDHPFEDEISEISYYKHILPQFKSLQVYCTEKYALLSGRPLTTDKGLKKYYLDELQYLERFFLRHHFQHEYFLLDLTQLDNFWFRKEQNSDVALPPVLEGYEVLDSPQMSYLFSKFIAYGKLREDILSFLDELEYPPSLSDTSVNNKGKLRKPFQWTGEKINLIEMVHGLYVRKQVNNGKIGIGEFFEAVGEFFGVDLGIPKRGFDDLKVRKKLSKTHFIDSMREELLRKMEDEDAYDPDKSDKKKIRL
jgi:hypothetical protein